MEKHYLSADLLSHLMKSRGRISAQFVGFVTLSELSYSSCFNVRHGVKE